jgi:hypothetical protein
MVELLVFLLASTPILSGLTVVALSIREKRRQR